MVGSAHPTSRHRNASRAQSRIKLASITSTLDGDVATPRVVPISGRKAERPTIRTFLVTHIYWSSELAVSLASPSSTFRASTLVPREVNIYGVVTEDCSSWIHPAQSMQFGANAGGARYRILQFEQDSEAGCGQSVDARLWRELNRNMGQQRSWLSSRSQSTSPRGRRLPDVLCDPANVPGYCGTIADGVDQNLRNL